MNHYYHLCGALLDKGSVILPGSFGHIIQNVYGRTHIGSMGNPERYLYEDKLEEYRQRHYPDKPSRLNCIFLCHSLENLQEFYKLGQRNFQFGYKVEIIGDVLSRHIADWNEFDNRIWKEPNWMEKLEESVSSYWSENREDELKINSKKLEILVNNKVKVLERVL